MDEVLMLGRAEVGELNFEPEPLNLIQICHDILAQLNLSQSPHNAVTFASEGDCRTVCMDSGHPFNQIVKEIAGQIVSEG